MSSYLPAALMTVAPETAQYGDGCGSNTISGVCSQRNQEKFTNYVNLSSTNVVIFQ